MTAAVASTRNSSGSLSVLVLLYQKADARSKWTQASMARPTTTTTARAHCIGVNVRVFIGTTIHSSSMGITRAARDGFTVQDSGRAQPGSYAPRKRSRNELIGHT